MPERILVTGGAGYIGCVLAPCCRFEGFQPIKGDVRDEGLIRQLIAKADIVIPLAALVGAPLCAQDPVNAVSVNRDAVIELLGMVGKTQRLVFPNSNSGYGIGQRNQYCTEETPLRPVSLYGTTKTEA